MYTEILSEQLHANISGMYLLIVWAVINIVGGVVMAQQNKHKPFLNGFFKTNARWNIFNLIIGISGLAYLYSIHPAEIDLKALFYTVFTFEKLMVLNAGLSIAYIAIGSCLVERGKHHKNGMFEGAGKALWLQGGFIFIFSLILYAINTVYNQRYSIFLLF